MLSKKINLHRQIHTKTASSNRWFPKSFFFIPIFLFALIASSSAQALDPVATWNALTLTTARVKSLNDAQAARLYAMVNIAMYDASNGIVSQKKAKDNRNYAVINSASAPKKGDLDAAAVAAAHTVLSGEFPDRTAIYNAQLQTDLALLGSSKDVTDGKDWGISVGTQMRALRANDGSTPAESLPADSVPPPGQYPTTWSNVQFRNMLPFGIVNPAIYVGAGPAALSSVDYAAALAEIKHLGSSANTDPNKLETYQYWSLGAGTSQPPGAWIQIALNVTATQTLAVQDKTRLFALVSMAMADTVAPTFMTKYTYRHWRPATAIRAADVDGNPLTDPDASWTPRAPNFGTSPEYWSGHSSFSGAAAVALAGFFCADDMPFSLVTDSSPGGISRSYASFSAAANEAGVSRVVGGIHFNFSNLDGIAAGRKLAAEILANKMLLVTAPTHLGRCPY